MIVFSIKSLQVDLSVILPAETQAGETLSEAEVKKKRSSSKDLIQKTSFLGLIVGQNC